MAEVRRIRSSLLAMNRPTDLRACRFCGGVIEGTMMSCPACGQWLGRGSLAAWNSCIVLGSTAIILAFFMPWFDGVSVNQSGFISGFDLARVSQQLATTASGGRPTAAASLALYLIPVAGLAMLGLLALARPLGLGWVRVGRLMIGVASIPFQIALLAALLSNNPGPSAVIIWPHGGLVATAIGSLLAIAGSVALGTPMLVQRRINQ